MARPVALSALLCLCAVLSARVAYAAPGGASPAQQPTGPPPATQPTGSGGK